MEKVRDGREGRRRTEKAKKEKVGKWHDKSGNGVKTLENEQLEKRGEAAESPPPAEESPDYCCTICRAARPAEWICS